MGVLDIFIVALVWLLTTNGYARGFFRQAGSLTGLVLGLFAGAALASQLARGVQSVQYRALVAIAVIIIVTILFSRLGEWIGLYFARILHHVRLTRVDKVAGAALGVVVGLISAWLLAAMLVRLPVQNLQEQIHRSAIIRSLDRVFPPAPETLARFGRILAKGGFPQVFTDLEPTPEPPVAGPTPAAVNAAASAGRLSTVRIEGLGCGGVVEGSGFVAAPGLVVTNAHVVAGIAEPVIFDSAGPHPATAVWFDPALDFAVLRTSGLVARPLPLTSGNVPRGTSGAVLGYPGGGPLSVSPAAVLGERIALGRDIYDRNLVRRNIYELQSNIRPGNSGGPVVASNGSVIGVVFAASVVRDDLGYALTASEAAPGLARAAANQTVSTGPCAAP